MDEPLYLPDVEIAKRILGSKRSVGWKELCVVLERHGLPRVDPLFGGRYWPAVKAWFDQRNGLRHAVPVANTQGHETWDNWGSSMRRDYNGAKAKVREGPTQRTGLPAEN